MSTDEVKKLFRDELARRPADPQYLDRNDEREILQIAIRAGMSLDTGRAVLEQVCTDAGRVLESAVVRQIKTNLQAALANDARIDQKEFELVFAAAKIAMQGRRNDREVRRLIVTYMEDSGNNKVKAGLFGNWYRALKKDLGVG